VRAARLSYFSPPKRPARSRGSSPRYSACVFPLLAGIKLLPRRELMLPAVNSSYFSRRVIRAAPALPFLPAERDGQGQPANKGFLLQQRPSEPDPPSSTV
jgi:hypothetical protein